MMAMGPGQNMMMNHGHGLSSGGDNSLSSMMGPRAPNAGQVGHNFQVSCRNLRLLQLPGYNLDHSLEAIRFEKCNNGHEILFLLIII